MANNMVALLHLQSHLILRKKKKKSYGVVSYSTLTDVATEAHGEYQEDM